MAIEGKIPASGPISFGAVRGLLGENDPNYPCYVEPKITAFFQKYLMRIPDEGGVLYYQSLLETGNRTLAEIEADIANSGEAQVVASIGVPIGVVGDAQDYNMNRDMFRVITKSNANQPIKASDLRSKDNSYTGYKPNYLLDIFDRPSTNPGPFSDKLILTNYFGGDQFVAGDTIKATTWGHRFSSPDSQDNDGRGTVRFSTSYLSVVNHFIQIGTYYESPEVRNHNGPNKYTSHQVYYDPAVQSLQLKTIFAGGARESWNSLIRIEYISYPIPYNFYQYYYDGYEDFVARYD